MILDSVLTLAIGRNTRTGRTLSDADWHAFRTDVRTLITAHGGAVVADTFGPGVGSDGVNEWEPEDSCVIVAINVPDPDKALRRAIASVLRRYEASSACFAIDAAHEPVFADTYTGWRAEYLGSDPLADHTSRLVPVTGDASHTARPVYGVLCGPVNL